MSLSCTAVPKYYGQFREKVIRGEIPVCKEIAMEMTRIDQLIANPLYYYDDRAVEGWIAFCENECTLTDGSDMHLLDSFKLWGESIFGWYRFVEASVYQPGKNGEPGRYIRKLVKRRLINRQFLIVGRSASKSTYVSTIQNFFLNVDTSTTHQVTTAPTMKQAEEVLSPIRTAITRARGPYFKYLTAGSIHSTTGSAANRSHLCSTKKGIENFFTGSLLEIRPMSIDKLQGLKTKVCSVDEWLSTDIRDNVLVALEQGAAKIPDYLILAVSSEGNVRNGPGDEIKLELNRILRGEERDDNTSIWYYKMDDVKEIKNPKLWVKANPNIGFTVSEDTYRKEKEKAENNPSIRNEILAKRFGIPSEGFTYFFTYEETIPQRKRDYWQMQCSLGVDLSMGDDFCGFTFLFPLPAERFGIKARSYITSNTLMKLTSAMRRKYDEFIEEGSLIVLEGVVLDLNEVYDDLESHIARCQYDVCSVGYDPYNAKEFINRWETENGPFGIVKVIQGARTESVPLGELKKLAGEKRLQFDELLMQFCMGNCITIEDTNGNRKLRKQRAEDKIDNVSAMMDAFVAYKLNKDLFG